MTRTPTVTIPPVKVPPELAEALDRERGERGLTWAQLLQAMWDAYSRRKKKGTQARG